MIAVWVPGATHSVVHGTQTAIMDWAGGAPCRRGEPLRPYCYGESQSAAIRNHAVVRGASRRRGGELDRRYCAVAVQNCTVTTQFWRSWWRPGGVCPARGARTSGSAGLLLRVIDTPQQAILPWPWAGTPQHSHISCGCLGEGPLDKSPYPTRPFGRRCAQPPGGDHSPRQGLADGQFDLLRLDARV